MTEKQILDRLDRLRTDRNEWQQMGNRQRLTVKLNDVRITIHDDPNAGTCWQLDDPTDERIMQAWVPASDIGTAMRESTDLARALILAGEHAHLPQR